MDGICAVSVGAGVGGVFSEEARQSSLEPPGARKRAAPDSGLSRRPHSCYEQEPVWPCMPFLCACKQVLVSVCAVNLRWWVFLRVLLSRCVRQARRGRARQSRAWRHIAHLTALLYLQGEFVISDSLLKATTGKCKYNQDITGSLSPVALAQGICRVIILAESWRLWPSIAFSCMGESNRIETDK